MHYREDKALALATKENYVEGITRLIAQRQERAEKIRDSYAHELFSKPEKYRQEFKEMLGWPLVDHESSGLPKVELQELSREDDYCIYRMKCEFLKDVTMTGLLFRANTPQKKPLVIVQHGGGGSPEHIGGFYDSTNIYNDMLHRVRKHGVHVFAPQLLLWSEDYGAKYDRQVIDAQLKRVGSSIAAVELYAITRILDYFQAQEYVSCFGMVGLSYGGFYTQYTAAIDTRICSAISCAFLIKEIFPD